MKEDTTILPFRQSETIIDPLTELARQGARRMLAEALKAEADAFVASFADEQLEDGRQRIVRHGFGPERKIQTGIGALDVQRPKVRDRMASCDGAEKIRFTSNILPKWARRSISLDALLPVLYLKGISTGDFQDALSAIMGPDAPNLSPSVISRLTAGWQVQFDRRVPTALSDFLARIRHGTLQQTATPWCLRAMISGVYRAAARRLSLAQSGGRRGSLRL